MSVDTVAVVGIIAFVAVMAAWIPLVECCARAMRRQPERERQKKYGRIIEMRPKGRTDKKRGYETVVLITMVTSLCSLGLLN